MKLKEILNLLEFIDINVNAGDILFLGNTKLKVIDISPMPFNPPRVINVETGAEFKLNRNDISKLTKTAPPVDGVVVERSFRDWIFTKLKNIEYPNQSLSFIKFVNKNLKSAIIQISFTEEIKDGRTPKFNKDEVFKLKNNTFTHNNINIKVTNVQLVDTDIENTRGSEYRRYYYSLKMNKV
jgi:hypothetical protein